MTKKPRIVCLMGPTATGKTDLAIALSQRLPCDLISVDSAMVYRGLSIGAAKPGAVTLKQFPHQLIDIRDPWEIYSAADFRADAIAAIEASVERGHIPLLVGGTMLYFKVLQQGIAELPEADLAIRAQLEADVVEHGLEVLHKRLQKVDPVAAARIHPNDPQRLQRALEIYELTGESMTALHQRQTEEPLPYECVNIALELDRSILHQRIEQRFDAMLEDGFLEELKTLYDNPKINADLPAIKSVAYQQGWRYLSGEWDLAMMREKAIVATRRLAKRQATWLRSWEGVHPIDALDEAEKKCADIHALLL
jgi:tRNA dimethylallyltransferase